jgi:transposase InsO family protein
MRLIACTPLWRTNWESADSLSLPPRSPNLNAHAERWVRSIKEECLSWLILFGENPPRRVAPEFLALYQHERNHQGKGNVILFPAASRAAGYWIGAR